MLGAILSWLYSQGLPSALYIGVGIVAYGQLEGWEPLETIYFLIVTSTTVGYGDLCPESALGRIFTCFYALLGVFVLMSAMSPIIEWVLEKRKIFEEGLDQAAHLAKKVTHTEEDAKARKVDARLAALVDADGDGVVSAEEAEELLGGKSISYTNKYLRALSGPLLVFLIGLGLGLGMLELSLVDATYFTVITMTTIGYGDISFINSEAKMCVGLFFLPLAVTALADAVSECSRIAVAKSIRNTDYAAKVDQLLLEEAKGNPQETLTEAEFLVSVLKSHGLVDDPTLRAIRIQFAKLTSHTAYKKGADPLLDAKAVFFELISQGRIVDKSQTVTDAKADRVNLKAPDGGYAEWYKTCWLPRVLGSPTGYEVQETAHETAKQDLRNPVFKLLNQMKLRNRTDMY